jgi:hypothetical protein
MSEVDPNQLTDEQLEQALFNAGMGLPAEEIIPEETKEEAPEPPPAEEPAQEAVEEPTPTEEAPQEVEDKEQSYMKEILDQWQLEKKALEAKLDLAQAHASRLAGEIGYLKKHSGVRSEPMRPDTESLEEPTTSDGETLSRLERIESEIRRRDREAAIAAEVASMRGPDHEKMAEEIKVTAEKYAPDWQAALETEDPEAARLMVRRVLNAVLAEAEILRSTKEREARQIQKAEQMASQKEAKKKAVPSASGSTPPPKPKPKTIEEMSDKELEEAMKEVTKGRW